MTLEEIKKETERGERQYIQEDVMVKNLPSFIWIPEFISLAGSVLYERENNRDPNDIDIIVRAQKEGGRFKITLDPSLRLKIDRVLKERLQRKDLPVFWESSVYGPNWKYQPLWDLALIPHQPEEVRLPNEPEFAREFYKERRATEEDMEKLKLEEFRSTGVDYDIEHPKERYRELIADLRYLGNSAYPKLKAGEKWGEWTLDDVLRYFGKIVDTLRKIYFPLIPPRMKELYMEYQNKDEKEWKQAMESSFWECYQEAEEKGYITTKPPETIEEAKEWDKNCLLYTSPSPRDRG